MVERNKESKKTSAGSELEWDLILPSEGGSVPSIASPDAAGDGLEADDRQAAEIREIFGTAFPQYLQPVEEVVEQILSGNGDPESVEALDGMISSLMEASSRMGFGDVTKMLRDLQHRISLIETGPNNEIPSQLREEILGDIMDLKDLAMEMGGQEAAQPKEQQQTILSLLKDKEGIGKVVLRRLSAAGLVTVDQIKMARPEEIAAVAGINLDIVQTIFKYVAEAEGKAFSDEGATPDKPDEIPGEIQTLHEQVLLKLRDEAELEARVEDLRAEIRGLRSRIFEYRTEIKSLDISLTEKNKAWDRFSDQIAVKLEFLDELRAKRDALIRKYSASEESIERKELRLRAAREERRKFEEEAIRLSRDVNSLVDRVVEVRRSVSRRRRV